MRIRYAKASDVDTIYEIGKSDFRTEGWFTKDIIRKTIKDNPRLCWSLEYKGSVIGSRLFCEYEGRDAWGWLIIIKSGMRHHHLGSTLFDYCCKQLKERGFKRIITDVSTKNKASMGWHKKMGYRKLGVVKDWYGRGKSAIILERRI